MKNLTLDDFKLFCSHEQCKKDALYTVVWVTQKNPECHFSKIVCDEHIEVVSKEFWYNCPVASIEKIPDEILKPPIELLQENRIISELNNKLIS